MKQTKVFYCINSILCLIFIPLPLIPVIIMGFVLLCEHPLKQIERVKSKTFMCGLSIRGFIWLISIVFVLSVCICTAIYIFIWTHISAITIYLTGRLLFMDLYCITNIVQYIRLLESVVKYPITKEDLAQRIANAKFRCCCCLLTC